ncbi:MAG: PDZ domain-containing protein [Acidobacteriota bacterium]
MKKNDCRKITLIFALLVIQVSIAFAQTAIKLDVDATEAAKNIIHVQETMPVKAGEFALFYPKWIPGEHAPTGTLNDIVNLYITANGKQLAWRRDDVEMFEFHLTIPNGVKEVEIAFDDVSQPGTIASANLSRIKWNRLILYPEGAKADDVNVMAALKLPADWKYATALETANETANPVQFKQVTLTKLVDSPAVVGKFYKKIPLIEVGGAMHEIDAFADSAEALEYNPATLEGWKNLIKQANAAFGAHHYNNYKFLLTLSDVGGSEGLEHHQSSEDGVGEKSFTDAYRLLDLGDLLGHEYTHSWNGKYRRPAGLATGDYETPMKAEFLWVYEGLTQYLGHVFPTRSGLWTPEDYREVLAADAADLNNETGRRWRPLVDTARAVQFTYGSPRAWRNERRRVDYYDEGALIWLEADVLIRQKSGGKKSLDDFLKKFHGGQNTAPKIVPYSFEDVTRTLNEVVPYDWRGFFNERIYMIQPNAPLGGITNGGWKLIYNETPNVYISGGEKTYNFVSALFSIGVLVNKDGTISDINPGLPAAQAGLAPGMKITKIGGEDFSIEHLHKAIAATKNNSPLELTAENGNSTETYKINYNGGERFPHLERDAAKTDYLSEIVKPLLPFGFVVSPGRTSRRQHYNGFANVTNLILNQTEITANCPANSTFCANSKQVITVSTEAVDPENDVLTYSYTVTAGKIVGQGASVVWDLSGVTPGTYTVTAGVADGCGICGETKTQTVTVKKCPDCKE